MFAQVLSPFCSSSNWLLVIQFGNVIHWFKVDTPCVRAGNLTHPGANHWMDTVEVKRRAGAAYPALSTCPPDQLVRGSRSPLGASADTLKNPLTLYHHSTLGSAVSQSARTAIKDVNISLACWRPWHLTSVTTDSTPV